tara:strand:+ start:10344 stop:11108 length:765 start_codon:yes stop_codon:yes gene_type:complete
MDIWMKHNVGHLSPSTLNLWISQPAKCLLKIGGLIESEAGASAWRGTATDRAITAGLKNSDVSDEDLIIHAKRIFDEQSEKASSDHNELKIKQEREDIDKYVKNGMEFYRQIDEPLEGDQGKIITRIPEVDVNVIGYYDLLYANKVRDIKSVGRSVSSLTLAHARQTAFYGFATGREPYVDYVSKKGVSSFKVDNVDYHIRQMTLAALSLEKVLSYSDDIIECCQLVYPDLDHWAWSDADKAVAKTVWQMETKK